MLYFFRIFPHKKLDFCLSIPSQIESQLLFQAALPNVASYILLFVMRQPFIKKLWINKHVQDN